MNYTSTVDNEFTVAMKIMDLGVDMSMEVNEARESQNKAKYLHKLNTYFLHHINYFDEPTVDKILKHFGEMEGLANKRVGTSSNERKFWSVGLATEIIMRRVLKTIQTKQKSNSLKTVRSKI